MDVRFFFVIFINFSTYDPSIIRMKSQHVYIRMSVYSCVCSCFERPPLGITVFRTSALIVLDKGELKIIRKPFRCAFTTDHPSPWPSFNEYHLVRMCVWCNSSAIMFRRPLFARFFIIRVILKNVMKYNGRFSYMLYRLYVNWLCKSVAKHLRLNAQQRLCELCHHKIFII